jgi:hypothetical protein
MGGQFGFSAPGGMDALLRLWQREVLVATSKRTPWPRWRGGG